MAVPRIDPSAIENVDDGRTCGGCRHGRAADADHVACFGAPPVPVMTSTQRDMLGRQVPVFHNMRPVMVNSEPACAKWEQKVTVLIGSVS